MKVFITGSESFVGRELVSQCLASGVQVVGVDLVPASRSDYEFHRVDIRSKEIVSFIPENVDAFIHLAAVSSEPACKNDIRACFDTNVTGTLHLMDAAKSRKVKNFIFASSEWVYNECAKDEVQNEESFIDAAKHTSSYALSKLTSEINLRQQYERGFCSVTILRFGIIYGPRKANWSAVESILSAVKNQDEVQVGSLKSGRRFIHVSDIARGIIKSIPLKGFNTINLSGTTLITIGDVVRTGQKLLHRTVRVRELNPNQWSIRNPSNEKAKKMLGWEPQITLEDGLRSVLPSV